MTGSCAGQPSYMNELEAGLEAMLANSAVAGEHDDWEPTIGRLQGSVFVSA